MVRTNGFDNDTQIGSNVKYALIVAILFHLEEQ